MCVPDNSNTVPNAGTNLMAAPPAQPQNNFGNRPDGTPKGNGWLGVIKRPDGNVMTEITTGVNINGKETDIPLITPYTTKADLQYLKNADVKGKDFFEKMPKGLMDRAVRHASERLKAGKSVYNE